MPAASGEEADEIRMISTGRWWQTWMIRPDRGSPFERWAASRRDTWERISEREGGGAGSGSGCMESMLASRAGMKDCRD